MKKLLPLLLVFCLLLCGCGGSPEETTEPSTEPDTTQEVTTEEVTTQPDTTGEAIIYRNPLNGEILEEPYTGRVFASTINNVAPALPYQGVSQADMLFEMLINDNATRCVALFTNVREVSSIGSVRSSRMNFVDVCQAYDAILGHAGYGSDVQAALNNRGVDHLHLGNVSGYRDQNRLNAGYAIEHTLFVNGQRFYEVAQDAGYEVTQPADKDYGLVFVEDGTPDGGEDASEIIVSFWGKLTRFYFNEETGKYELYLHGDYVIDENNGQRIAFENVVIMRCKVHNEGVYHIADVEGSGDGYYACNGKIIPIQWHHENPTDPFTFTLEDGTPLEMGVGTTYVAFQPDVSDFTYQ